MAAIGPLVIKALIAIGIGTVTFTGVTVALDSLINMAVTNWAGVMAAVVQLASLAGVPECMGIICGAMSARVAIWVAASATKFVLKA
jgi:hypothetical protein